MPACSAARRGRSAASLDHLADVDLGGAGHRVHTLHPRQLHQFPDQPGQPGALVLHPAGEPRHRLGIVGGVLHRLGEQGERADRRLQFVRDVRDEVAAHRLEATLLADVGEQQGDRADPLVLDASGTAVDRQARSARGRAVRSAGRRSGSGAAPWLARPARRARQLGKFSRSTSRTFMARAAGLTRISEVVAVEDDDTVVERLDDERGQRLRRAEHRRRRAGGGRRAGPAADREHRR